MLHIAIWCVAAAILFAWIWIRLLHFHPLYVPAILYCVLLVVGGAFVLLVPLRASATVRANGSQIDLSWNWTDWIAATFTLLVLVALIRGASPEKLMDRVIELARVLRGGGAKAPKR